MKKQILIIVHHRKGRSAGQRFRIELFIPQLKAHGCDIIFSNIISARDDAIFYAHRHYLRKLWLVIKSFFHRLKDLRLAKKCSTVFIYREAFMLGTTFFERRLARACKNVIFDFDDSIWLNDTSDGNKKLAWLKNAHKTSKICRLATCVTVGNRYLADYARQFNNNVRIIPTVLNTDYHKPTKSHRSGNQPVCIGWTGSQTTLKHLKTCVPVLQHLKQIYGDKIYFKVISDIIVWDEDLDIEQARWSEADEIQQLSDFDIGIMPLPDDAWARGKCGFKGLQCMAMAIPVVMSPVGVNVDIVKHGINGFLASSHNEWVKYLSMLIDNPDLRHDMGIAGRNTVVNKFSVNAWNETVMKLFQC